MNASFLFYICKFLYYNENIVEYFVSLFISIHALIYDIIDTILNGGAVIAGKTNLYRKKRKLSG
jgi:hypothetical protein